MVLHIKYMVSLRCRLMVQEELKKLGLRYVEVDLGNVEIMEDITPAQRERLEASLNNMGLELLDDRKGILIEQIKHIIIGLVHYSDSLPNINFSDYLSEKMGMD